MHDKIWSDQNSVETTYMIMNERIFPGFSSQRLVPSQGRSPLWRFLASGLSSYNYLDLNLDYLLTIAHLSQLRFSVMGFRWLGIYIWLFTFRVLTLNVIFVWHWFKYFAVGHDWTRVQWAVCLHHKHCWPAQAGGWNFFGILTMIVTSLPSSLKKILQPQIPMWQLCHLSSATDCKIDFQSLAVTVWHQDKLKQNDYLGGKLKKTCWTC